MSKPKRMFYVALRPGKPERGRACVVDDTDDGGDYVRDFKNEYPHLEIRHVGFEEMQRLMSN